MEVPSQHTDRLVAAVLRQVEHTSRSAPTHQHPSEETIVQFVIGELSDAEQLEVVEHLDQCDDCRELVAALMAEESESVPMTVAPDTGHIWWRQIAGVVAAVAASLLVTIIAWRVWMPSGGSEYEHVAANEAQVYQEVSALLNAARFDRAEEVLEQARAAGMQTPLLKSLEAQVRRRIAAPIALSRAGRLTYFGHNIGGLVARSSAGQDVNQLWDAHQVLEGAGDDELPVLLNRGHVLLSLNRPDEALTDFQQAAKRFPEDPLPWLGLGLAHFLANDAAAAEASFRQTLRLDEDSKDARFNLALALEEQERWTEAMAEWQILAGQDLAPQERVQVEQAMHWLREQMQ